MQPQIIIPKKRNLITFILVMSILAIVLLSIDLLPKLLTFRILYLSNIPRIFILIYLIFTATAIMKTTRHNGPGLAATPVGFEDNVSFTHFGLIEWKDIEGFQITRFLFAKQVRVFLRNYPKYEARLDASSKLFNQANNFLVKPPMPCYYLQINFLEGRAEEIVKHLNLYLEAMRMR